MTTGIDYAAIAAAGGIGKGTALVVVRRRRRTRRGRALRLAYAAVDLRDESVCWVTGITLTADADDLRYRREHHHLAGRRVRPEWVNDPHHIITVSAAVHALITSKRLRVHGLDARESITFSWNRRFVPVGREPFPLDRTLSEVA